ncbi:bacillithiol system redox-active protein YtxJ [Flavobacterium dankookense]|uniref:Bacillithiol system protein YtxJ n=1 Tax=Flavobacterium dankookense TaxID=706186 RepID=A0A4R6QEC2_9FLAO|nr:bacillithiol system redox-active protein YtxJ [Flavobacterium dankookense]TDP61058.1 bacillithiol system protein YtxJ [Flavobacterium dankookense]
MSLFKNIFGSSEEDNKTSKKTWRQLTDLGQLNEIVEVSNEKLVLIFKHSTRCSISRYALKQFENEFAFGDKIVTYFLDLIEFRDISNEIAQRFGVIHQSPQIILIKEGKAIYDTSHESIEAKKLESFI